MNIQNIIKIDNKFKLYIWYSLSFIAIVILSFYVFYANRKTLLWSLDGFPVLYPSFVEVNKSFFSLSSFNINIGWGTDGISFFSNWYFEPFEFIASLFDKNPGVITYSLITLIKLYCTGIAFSLYCLRKKLSYYSIYISSLIYVFSAYTMYIGIRFPVFLVPMIYLPLIILGMDEIDEKNFSIIFVIMIALSAISHIYFLYINVIFCIIYFLVSCFVYNNKINFYILFKKISNYILNGLLGIGLAAFVFLPTVYVLLNSNRTSSIIASDSLFYYSKNWIAQILAYIPSPMTSYNQPNYEFYIGVIPLALLCICSTSKCDKEYLKWRIIATILFIFMLFPFFAYVFCGFNNISNRWTYIWTFSLSYISCQAIDKENYKQNKNPLLYILLFVFLLSIALHINNSNIFNIYTITGVLCTTVFFILYYADFKILNSNNQFIKKGLIIITVFFSIVIYNYLLFNPNYGNYIQEFADIDQCKILFSKIEYPIIDTDDTLYRIEFQNNKRNNLGLSYLNEYSSTGFYSNTTQYNISDFLRYINNSGFEENIINYDMDSRTQLMELLSVKYYIKDNGEPYNIPYGYSLFSKNEQYTVYTNDYYNPFVFSYNKCISRDKLNGMDSVEKEEVMMSAAIIEDNNSISNKEFFTSNIDLSNIYEYDFDISYNGIKYVSENLYYVEYPGATIVFNINNNTNKSTENYLLINNMKINKNGIAHWNIAVSSTYEDKTINNNFAVLSEKNNYNPQVNNYTINLGYSDSPLDNVTITFPVSGMFSFDTFEIKSRSFIDYNEKIKKLQSFNISEFKMEDNNISFNISNPKNNIVMLSVPYTKGWELYIDDKKADTFPVNIAFMGFNIDEGFHTVKLQYNIPFFKAGKIVSISSLIILFILCMYRFLFKNIGGQK